MDEPEEEADADEDLPNRDIEGETQVDILTKPSVLKWLSEYPDCAKMRGGC